MLEILDQLKPMTKAKDNIEILYEDDAILVINKPAGLDSVRGMYSVNCVLDHLEEMLKDKLKEPLRVIHRLDRDASGILILAKTKEAQRELTSQWEEGTARKQYIAIVQGHVNPPEDTIELPLLKRVSKSRPVVVDTKHGKPAISEYRLLRQYNRYAILEVETKTGRMHQIRVHLSARGFPIVCDPHYGERDALYLSKIKRRYKRKKQDKEQDKEKPLIARLALHAYKITFRRPSDQKEMELTANLPKDIYITIKQLEKYGLPKSSSSIDEPSL